MTKTNRIEIRDILAELIADLDNAIEQAVENPLLFASHPLLPAVQSRCAEMDQAGCAPSEPDSRSPSLEKLVCEKLVWDVRARSGRLQMLLDSASVFYSACFSSTQLSGLDYGMHGEWGAMASPGHLAIDC